MADINDGPLTTTFTPPTACETQTADIYLLVQSDGDYFAQGPVDPGSCWPSGYSAKTNEYYSPGICPSGFTPACNRTNIIGLSTETIQTCCPVSLQHTCRSLGHIGWGDCYWELDQTEFWTLTSITVINSSITSTASFGGQAGAINALGVQVRFQSTDFVSATSTKTSIQRVPTTEPSGTDTSGGERGSLSQGARAGIGVGVAIGVLAIISFAVFIFLRKRKNRRSAQELHSETKPSNGREDGGAIEMPIDPSHVEMATPGQQSGYEYHHTIQSSTFELEADAMRHPE
ncbi:hypothetical protein F4779DRAFT_106859 [Xylariaceae sp. FL0662B]|nr:hypothetical protein F4779DRAFT_106859 [Xylariaceae sp. FL0662B]